MVASAAELSSSSRIAWHALVRNWRSIGQLLLATVVIHLYHIDDPSLLRVIVLATIGFSISVVLPRSSRLSFFVALSLAGCFAVLGIRDGTCLIALGLLFIGICRLPVPVTYRVLGLLATGGLLAFLRGRWSDTPWSSAVWPFLGSIFMFRTILYLRAIASRPSGHGIQHTLAYFFMLPNFAFQLFPVVDYQTFRRTYFDTDELKIYEPGLLWISRGLVQLVLYRFVNQNVLKFDEFVSLSDVIRWMIGTLLLYLRVSGQFHIAVGVLHLFGFRLPETHKRYFLAHSFTELWRRMNVYWTTFMTNVVFYPVYFRAKRFGSVRALAISTAAVFVATWALHSYQWFWLRGGFPIRIQDVLFWGVLGILVTRGAIKEQKSEREPRQPSQHWNWKSGFRTTRTFIVLCVLWSLWSTNQVEDWLDAIWVASHVDYKGVFFLVAVFTVVSVLGAYDWSLFRNSKAKWIESVSKPVFRSTAGLVVLLILGQSMVQSALPARFATTLDSLMTPKANTFNFGYYEQLDNVGLINDYAAEIDCRSKFRESIMRRRKDYVGYDLNPSLHLTVACGAAHFTFSTNSHGMRDKEYTVAKPGNTLRMELIGPSFAIGMWVSDADVFEQVVEDRLNTEFSCPEYQHFEILNLSAPALSLPHELATLEARGLGFSPDIVIMLVTMKSRELTAEYLSQMSRNNVAIPYEPVRMLLAEAGLDGKHNGTVPIPFHSLRSIAQHFGIDSKISEGESTARARTIADRVDKWAIQRFAQVTAQHGVTPILLALDDVEDDMTPATLARQIIRESGISAIDLLNVYPEANRHSLWVSSWDPHPNATGHRIIADKLYAELLPFVRTACSASAAHRTESIEAK